MVIVFFLPYRFTVNGLCPVKMETCFARREFRYFLIYNSYPVVSCEFPWVKSLGNHLRLLIASDRRVQHMNTQGIQSVDVSCIALLKSLPILSIDLDLDTTSHNFEMFFHGSCEKFSITRDENVAKPAIGVESPALACHV